MPVLGDAKQDDKTRPREPCPAGNVSIYSPRLKSMMEKLGDAILAAEH